MVVHSARPGLVDTATEHLGDQDLELVGAALVVLGDNDVGEVVVERRQVTHGPILAQDAAVRQG
jgi:hypothetical protein